MRRPRRLQRPPRRQDAVEAGDLRAAARAAGLRYVSDAEPGIRRKRDGRAFVYLLPDGTKMRDKETLRRIRSLVIPPAWKDVWISPSARGHIQATGRDARGRKQYRYHARWREWRDETKYGRMPAFARALPLIRKTTDEHMALAGLPREKVLAAVVRLLENSLIRVGNEEYTRDNQSYGLTTLRDEHVQVDGSTVHFEFRGKSGVEQAVDLRDRRLARIVKNCQDLPGQVLFQYVNGDGQQRAVSSGDVNGYLREVTGQDFTAKDFRTWAGTVLAALALEEFEAFDSQAQAKRNVVRAIDAVANRLGNTRAVSKKCYVHPEIVEAYLDGELVDALRKRTEDVLRGDLAGLTPQEGAVLAFLQRRLARERPRRTARSA
jgi:DNA topoisomerase-1